MVDERKKVEQRIKREIKRLNKIFEIVDDNIRGTVDGLIKKAAFERVELEELKTDILIYGWTDWFSQGDQEPYKRKRPEADIYNTLSREYSKTVKQLSDLLPKSTAKAIVDDGFESFVDNRTIGGGRSD